jgi:hypothetical protein
VPGLRFSATTHCLYCRPFPKELQAAGAFRQGATEKIKRENDVHLRQLAKKSTYVLLSFFFSAFLGVSRQGDFENTRKKIEYVSKKNHRGNIFLGGIFFLGKCF